MTIERFIVFGATGDLAARSLVPAIARLHHRGLLPPDVQILGVGHEDWDTAALRDRLEQGLTARAPDVPADARAAVLSRLTYQHADVTDAAAVRAVIGDRATHDVYYLALPPGLFPAAIEAIASSPRHEDSRLVIEKPFGEDLHSAQTLNRIVHRCFAERSVFRMDHFLGKQTVQNILGLRFANRLFEPVWNHEHIARVEITFDETIALEGRAGFYDRTGALRDVVQNHLLQLLALVAMDPPASFSERDLRDRKAQVLRAVRRPSPDEIGRDTVRARYVAGGDHPAYTDEPGVEPDRCTETFAAAVVWIDNWRWAGVPFVLRTGKALASDRHEIVVRFRPVPHLAFGDRTEAEPNVLRLEMDPDRMALGIDINGPGDPFDLEHTQLVRELAPQSLDAYARLLLDVVEGDPTLSIRDDEAEESWRIVEPVLAAWHDDAVPMLEYPAGSPGPPLRL